MIVYGDAVCHLPFEHARQRLINQALVTDAASLDDLRTLLVQCGQAEQALEDASFCTVLKPAPAELTDAVAEAFVGNFSGWERDINCFGKVQNLFARIEESWNTLENVRLHLTIPEGFEFHSLYPEQYCRSAERWSREHQSRRGRVLVVGVRSIGTTLSAVVQTVLSRAGWSVRRMTVRPEGHPFERRVELPEAVDCEYAIVVDEGPGLSGSSIVSVAVALQERGVAPGAISLFPGHDKQPGQYANDQARDYWARAKRYFTPLAAVAWKGRTLDELMAARTKTLLGSNVVETLDFSAGDWRHSVFAEESEWPAVATPFERTKYHVTTKSRKSLVWKFTGLGCMDTETPIAHQADSRARMGWTPAPCGYSFGFTAFPWIEGETLKREHATDEVLDRLAAYIADTSGPELSGHESAEAVERLTRMMAHNLKEAGELTDVPAAPPVKGVSYGDGRMAPHEWLFTSDSRLIKTDAYAHTRDHTIIGRQSILWDVAGVIVEWDLSISRREVFLRALSRRDQNHDALNFYVAAYAAFRMGLMLLCAEGVSDAEGRRLRSTAEYYRRTLTNRSEPAIA
jgi:hypothetical protein